MKNTETKHEMPGGFLTKLKEAVGDAAWRQDLGGGERIMGNGELVVYTCSDFASRGVEMRIGGEIASVAKEFGLGTRGIRYVVDEVLPPEASIRRMIGGMGTVIKDARLDNAVLDYRGVFYYLFLNVDSEEFYSTN